MAIITIVGAGVMGTALCWPLAHNGHSIRLVGTHLDEAIVDSVRRNGVHPRLQRQVPEGVLPYNHIQIEEALNGADLVVSGVSSFGVGWFAHTVGPYLRPEVPVIMVTKGLQAGDDGQLQVFPHVIDAEMPEALRGRISLNAIGGPCISHELAAGRHTGVVFCGPSEATLAQLKDWFVTPYYHIRTSTDVVGVEAAAALKNGYALGVALAIGWYEKYGTDGLAHMYNPQAVLFAQAVMEMGQIIDLMGGDPAQANWLPGAGDLYVTAFGGRTSRLGRLLGQGYSYGQALEALAGETLEAVEVIRTVGAALPELEQQGALIARALPLMRYLYRLVGGEPAGELPWDRFWGGE